MKILIATDGQPSSEHAIREAARILPLKNAEVVLVSVVQPEERIGGNPDAAGDLEGGLAILADAGVEAETLTRRGEPAEEIVKAAKALKADVIVVGAARRGKIAQFLVGSVSGDVVKHWPGAVLVVREP